ncbi:MAG: phosphoribosylanthranilate isomerase [Spirochaetia bacterium]|jgi:phosphoribosylanthranilate isomerase|nr:phosphoribosylanthranilate isomerase [Spirochaetia bacterium]
MRIKICGLFREEDIAYANEALPDYAGFVFAAGSRRFIRPEAAARLREKLDGRIIPVGVFVREKPEEIAALWRDGLIGMAQLHGGEDGGYIARLREICGAPLVRALDAAALDPRAGLCRENLSGGADYILLDRGAGGGGRRFDWRRLVPGFASCGLPFFLAGGIGLGNIGEAMGYNPYALDVSSGAESGGVKDREKMVALVKEARAY